MAIVAGSATRGELGTQMIEEIAKSPSPTPQKAAERQDGITDLAARRIEDQIFDLAQLVARRVVDHHMPIVTAGSTVGSWRRSGAQTTAATLRDGTRIGGHMICVRQINVNKRQRY